MRPLRSSALKCSQSAQRATRLELASSTRSGSSANELRQLRVEPRGARSGGRGSGSDMVLPRLAVRGQLVARTGMIKVGDAGDTPMREGTAHDEQAGLTGLEPQQ